MLAVTFRMRRPRGFGSVTAGRHGLVLHTWCNLETDFVEVFAPDEAEAAEALQGIVSRFGPDLAPAPNSQRGPSSSSSHAPGAFRTCALLPCPAERATSVSLAVERHGGLVQPPIVSSDGWDTFRVVLFDDAKAPALLRGLTRLGELQILSKRPLDALGARAFLVPTPELLDGLTRRQAEALVLAATRGYYTQPRRTTLAELAAESGIGRATWEEHLRKAENKLLNALAPFVAVRAGSLKPVQSRGRPFAGKRRRKTEPLTENGRVRGPPARPALPRKGRARRPASSP